MAINNVILPGIHPVYRVIKENEDLLEGIDYELVPQLTDIVRGYGDNPVNAMVLGISCFDPEPTIPIEDDGFLSGQVNPATCAVLVHLPNGTKLAQDYNIDLRLNYTNEEGKRKQRSVQHYTLFPVENVTLNMWKGIILEAQNWQNPNSTKELSEPTNKESLPFFNDGTEDGDRDGLTDFAVDALYRCAKVMFPSLSLHDQILMNGVLTLIANTKPSMNTLLQDHCPLMHRVYHIFRSMEGASGTMSILMGLVEGKIEDAYFHQSEEDDDAV